MSESGAFWKGPPLKMCTIVKWGQTEEAHPVFAQTCFYKNNGVSRKSLRTD